MAHNLSARRLPIVIVNEFSHLMGLLLISCEKRNIFVYNSNVARKVGFFIPAVPTPPRWCTEGHLS